MKDQILTFKVEPTPYSKLHFTQKNISQHFFPRCRIKEEITVRVGFAIQTRTVYKDLDYNVSRAIKHDFF